MSMSKAAALCALLGAVVGAAAMWSVGGVIARHGPQVAEVTARSSEVPALREDLPAAREIVFPPMKATQADASPGSPQDALKQLPADRLAIYDEARGMVDTALQHGSWTGENRKELHERLMQLPADVRQEVVGRLIVAVNNKKVRFEGRGPLF